MAAAQRPAAGRPGLVAGGAVQRDRPADRVAALGVEAVDDRGAGVARRERPVVVGGVEVIQRGRVAAGQPGLVPQPPDRVLVGGDRRVRGQADGGADRGRDRLGVGGRRVAGFERIGEQGRVVPQRRAVRAPVHADQPARQRLARVPLALAVRDQGAGREVGHDPLREIDRQAPLRRAVGGRVPLRRVRLDARDERRLAAHRQAHVAVLEVRVDGAAERLDARPLLGAVGQRDARVLVDPAHDVRVLHRRLGWLDGARDRGGGARLRRARERDVALAGEQAGGRVEADPAGAREVGLGPRVQVGEVPRRAGELRAGHDVLDELHEVAGGEAGRDADPAQRLHEQPRAVAARADRAPQRLVGRLDARLHAYGVADAVEHAAVARDEEVDRAPGLARDRRDPVLEERAGGFHDEVRREVLAQLGVVVEGPLRRGLVDEEVERVDDGHVRDEVDGDRELADGIGEDEAREVVAERVLLPVDEVLAGRDLQAVGEDRRAAVRGGAQAHDLRPEPDLAVVAVDGLVLDGKADAHEAHPSSGSLGRRLMLAAPRRRAIGPRGRVRTPYGPVW